MQKNSVILLHAFGDLSGDEGDTKVVDGVHIGSEVKLLEELLDRDRERPGSAFRLFCGYSGWGEGQLDEELQAGGWLTLPATAEHVFDCDPDALWTKALEAIGGPYKFFSMMPPHPELN